MAISVFDIFTSTSRYVLTFNLFVHYLFITIIVNVTVVILWLFVLLSMCFKFYCIFSYLPSKYFANA